jgi:transposase
MSRPMADTPKRRPRRQFTDEFKASAVRLVLDDGKTVGAAARDLDLTETALREWVKRARADRTHGRTGLTTAEREELARLRKENRELRTERDILKNESRALVRPDLWARNSVAYARNTRGRGRPLSGDIVSPLKNMVRGWPAHMSVVTPQGDPV